jgi:MYXO-CTERM domain-containing protein
MQRATCLSFAILVALTAVAAAQPVINVGSHNIPGGTTSTFTVSMTGTAQVAGASWFMQVADAGPENGLGSISGPTISGVTNAQLEADVSGTSPSNNIFLSHGEPLGNFNDSNPPTETPYSHQLLGIGITTASGTVTDNGLILTITVDASAFPATGVLQTWALTMSNTLLGSTVLFDNNGGQIVPTVIDGSLNILPVVVPEPTSLVLGLFAAAGLGVVVLRRRRTKA